MLTERKMLRLCSAGSLQVLDLFTLDPDTAKGCFLFASEHIGAVKNDLFNLLWKYILCNQKGDENFTCPNLSLALDIITRFCYASRRCYLAALDNIGEIAKCIKALCATSKSRKVISSSTTFLSLLFKFANHPRHLRVSKKREVKNIHSCHPIHPIHPTVEPVFDSSSFITLKYTQESHNSELNKSHEQTEHGKELVGSSKKEEEEEEEEEYVDTEFVEDETEIGVTTNEDDITINNDIHDDIIKNNMIDVSSNIQEQESVATTQTISSSSPSKKILSASNEKHDNHIEAVKDESVEQIRLIVRKSHDIELYENVSDSLQLKDKNISKDIGNISLSTEISMTWRTAIPWISEFELKRRIEELSILWKEALLLPTNYHDDINEINHNERELEDNRKVEDHIQKGDIDAFNDKVEDKLKEDVDDINDTGNDIRREEEEEEEEEEEITKKKENLINMNKKKKS
jgi:hypothetical protein